MSEELIAKGKLWKSFGNTDWNDDLEEFFKDQKETLSESIVSLTIACDYEKAKAYAHQLDGVLKVQEYIQSWVNYLNEIKAEGKEQKEYEGNIPTHV